MPLNANCPQCGSPIRVPDELLGKRVECPKCEARFRVGGDDEEPPRKRRVREPEVVEDAEIVEDDDQEERPRRRRRDADDDYDDERPRRRRRQELGWLDKTFRDYPIALLVLFAFCCNGIALIFGIVGVAACKDETAKRNARTVLIIAGIMTVLGIGVQVLSLTMGPGRMPR